MPTGATLDVYQMESGMLFLVWHRGAVRVHDSEPDNSIPVAKPGHLQCSVYCGEVLKQSDHKFVDISKDIETRR